MRRRTFLKATLATAGSVVLGPACGNDGGGGGDAGGGAGDGGDGGGGDGDAVPEPEILDGAAFFPQSVASGDPKPESVVLWTRVEDGAGDKALRLEVALDEAFLERVALDGAEGLEVAAKAEQDHCAKVRVAGLAAGTTYFYRFLYEKEGAVYASRTGRTRTAPAADADVPIRFAVVSCQDFIGKYYNTYKRLADEELDFVLHLGDYVYETTGDPAFQDETPDRVVAFTDVEGAIPFDLGEKGTFYAAQSLSNYRELYRTYRGDADLQRIHERFPMICIWDDHEFTDDSWGTHATYFDGAQGEDSPDRRRNADRAWSEYMPVDLPAGPDFVYDPAVPFPGDLEIYRDLTFGKHLHLVVTDLRRYRADHVVPEDAFPGAVFATGADLESLLGAVPDRAVAYVDVDAHDGGALRDLLVENAAALGISSTSKIAGLLSVPWINGRLETLNETAAEPHPLLDPADPAFARGFAYHQLLKNGEFSNIGSRYFVAADVFDVLTRLRWKATGGASEDALGAEQEAWLLDTLQGSTATWKVWGSEFVMLSRKVDLSSFPTLPASFQTAFYLSAEDWDGLPRRRDQLVDALAAVPNTVVVSGDIHSFFAGHVTHSEDPSKRLVEFAGGAISSSTYRTLLVRAASSDPALAAAGAPALAYSAGDFLTDPEVRPNPHLAYQDLVRNGFFVVDVHPERLDVTLHAIDEAEASAPLAETGAALAARFEVVRFRVAAGSTDLFRDFDGTFKRWDEEAFDWVPAAG